MKNGGEILNERKYTIRMIPIKEKTNLQDKSQNNGFVITREKWCYLLSNRYFIIAPRNRCIL